MVSVIGTEAQVGPLMPQLDGIVVEGMVAISNVQVVVYGAAEVS
jgi:PII-like signaling protein